MDARETKRLADAAFDEKKVELRTHCFCQVTGYDDAQNLVKLKPVRKAIRFTDANNTESVELPELTEILVRQYGSGKLWCTVAPAIGSYGYVHISDRDIDNWKVAGGIVEPSDTRCMDLRDAVFEPSLMHLVEDGDNGLMVEPIKTDRISLRTRSGLTEISVMADETIHINVSDGKSTLTIDTDGKVSLNSEDDITLTATGNFVTSAAETVVQDGTDYAVQFTAMKAAFDQLKNELNALVTAYNAHIHITTATVGASATPGVIAPTTSTGTPPTADMAGAKVADVRLP